MPTRLNIIGRRFGRAIVLEEAPPHINPNGSLRSKSRCQCDCGTIFVAWNIHLIGGRTKRCPDCSRKSTTAAATTHGLSKSHLYYAWRNMLNRCFWEKGPDYKRYGKRGISCCPQWRPESPNAFQTFRNDVGEAPPGKTLERIDNSKGYEAGNVSWETRTVQARNRRTNIIFTVRGITACLAELCERFEVPYHAIYNRIHIYGLSADEAFSKPFRKSPTF